MITTSRTATGAVALPTAPAVIFALLGLIDIALTAVIGSSDAPPLIVSLGVATLGLITLLALVPARRGSRGALTAIVVTRVISAVLAVPAFFLNAPAWASLGTAYFALLAPIAMGCIAVAILRTRALPRWTGYVFVIAAVLLLGQYAAFRGALPFPQFLAFIAIGIAALVHRAPAALSVGPESAELAARD